VQFEPVDPGAEALGIVVTHSNTFASALREKQKSAGVAFTRKQKRGVPLNPGADRLYFEPYAGA
jgi:hypothetical protein